MTYIAMSTMGWAFLQDIASLSIDFNPAHTVIYASSFDFGTPLYAASIELRKLVLRIPLGLDFLAEDLKNEYLDYHIGIFNPFDELLGTLLLHELNDSTLKMRQVAIHPHYQRKGLGTMLVKESEKAALQMNRNQIVLHARQEAIPFYEKMGYHVTSPPFIEVGIKHSAMKKAI